MIKHVYQISLFILLLFSLISCKKLSSDSELRINLGSQFQNDWVKVKLDNELLLADTITTNEVLGVAQVIQNDYPKGKYQLTVEVNGQTVSEKFRHKKNRFIVVNYSKSHETITIEYPSEKYTYD